MNTLIGCVSPNQVEGVETARLPIGHHSLSEGFAVADAEDFTFNAEYSRPGLNVPRPLRHALLTVAVAAFRPLGRFTLFVLLTALATGCSAEPFTRAPLPALKNADPVSLREHFSRAVPERYTSENSLVIQVPFRDDLAVLMVLNVDRPAGTFRLLGLHQMGISVFDIGGDKDGPKIYSAIPQLMEHKDILLSFARDFQRTIFDLTPPPDAKVNVQSNQICFKEGSLSYEFGDNPAVLLEKRISGFFGTSWRARYYDYSVGAGGKIYPAGTVIDNGQYHYRIIVKNRNWSTEVQ